MYCAIQAVLNIWRQVPITKESFISSVENLHEGARDFQQSHVGPFSHLPKEEEGVYVVFDGKCAIV